MKFDCGEGGGRVHRVEAAAQFCQDWRVAGCEILEMGKANRFGGDIGLPSVVFASLFSLNP
jgi:hypothetical protein